MQHAQRYGISYTILLIKALQRVDVIELGVDEEVILKLKSNDSDVRNMFNWRKSVTN